MIKKFILLSILSFLSISIAQENSDDVISQEDLERALVVSPSDLDKVENKSVDSNFVTNLMGDVAKKMIADFMKENPFSKMGYHEVKDHIYSLVKDPKMKKRLEENPTMLNLGINVLRDKEAIPAFLGILNRPHKMKTYSICFVIIMIVGFAFNLKKSDGNILIRIRNKLFIMLGTFSANIGCFYFLFKKEIGPMVKVFTEFFL